MSIIQIPYPDYFFSLKKECQTETGKYISDEDFFYIVLNAYVILNHLNKERRSV